MLISSIVKTMNQASPETIWNMKEKELLALLDKGTLTSRNREIRFYAPSFMYYKTSYYHSSSTFFPTISITGTECALNCKHCGALVLQTMYPAKSPEKLFELCVQLKAKGAHGCLISGGCMPDGSVPLENFIGAITKIKRELGLTVIVHTGVIDKATAEALACAKVDSALLDIVGSNNTIKEICNLDVKANDYASSMRALQESGVPFVPHLIVGLHYGQLEGEFDALRIIQKYRPSALVIIAFMPIHGTEMETVEPPHPSAIAKVVAVARTMFNETPLVLGCMRPKGKHKLETDIMAIKAGVDAIAFPAEQAISFAQHAGRTLIFSSTCCSQIYADLANTSSFKNPCGKGFG